MGDDVSNPIDTGAMQSGALRQPRIQGVGEYELIVAADVNGSRYSPAPGVPESLADWSSQVHHSPDTSGHRLLEITRAAPANTRIAEIFEEITHR
jgi:hypothetical protein